MYVVSKGDPRPKRANFVDPNDWLATLILWCRIHGHAQRAIPYLPGTQMTINQLQRRLFIND
jgi:hypothetical protein